MLGVTGAGWAGMPLICVSYKCRSLCGSRALGAGSPGGCRPLLWMRLGHGCLRTPTPRPLPMLFGASSQHPCLHCRTPRQGSTCTLLSIRCEPQRSHIPFVASVSLKLSGPSQSPQSLVTIPGPWQGVGNAGVCSPPCGGHSLDDEPRP